MTFSCWISGFESKYCYSAAEVVQWLIDIYGLAQDIFLNLLNQVENLPEFYHHEDLALTIWRHP